MSWAENLCGLGALAIIFGMYFGFLLALDWLDGRRRLERERTSEQLDLLRSIERATRKTANELEHQRLSRGGR
jgi:hypothetical protein